MAKLVFGLNPSLDGYVDYLEFATTGHESQQQMKTIVRQRTSVLLALSLLPAMLIGIASGQSSAEGLWTDDISVTHLSPAEAVGTNDTAAADQRRRGEDAGEKFSSLDRQQRYRLIASNSFS